MALHDLAKRHSKTINVAATAFLAILSLLGYLLLIVLFVAPHAFHISSLVTVENGRLSPTVAIGLITTVFSGATTALLTRAVEQHLWFRLVAQEDSRSPVPVSAEESRRLAQWSVSPLARLLYPFSGASVPLRLGGILLFTTAILQAVLLSGVSPRNSGDSWTNTISSTQDQFFGYLDAANSQNITTYGTASNARDPLMEIAALISLSNVTAPAAAGFCPDDAASCTLTATVAAFQATCTASTSTNPERVGADQATELTGWEQYCSSHNSGLCVRLVGGQNETFANFTTGASAACARWDGEARDEDPVDLTSTDAGLCAGEWAVIFGAWVFLRDEYLSGGSAPVQIVDCLVQYGNASLSQSGSQSPSLDTATFTAATVPFAPYSRPWIWQRIWATTPNYYAPYSFSGVFGNALATDSLWASSLGVMLLGYGADTSPAAVVARRIEAAFTTATLAAFARAPDAAAVQVAVTAAGATVWQYKPAVLVVLLAPALATLAVLVACGATGFFRIAGDGVVVGYDPVEIGRRGAAGAIHVTEEQASGAELVNGGDKVAAAEKGGAVQQRAMPAVVE